MYIIGKGSKSMSTEKNSKCHSLSVEWDIDFVKKKIKINQFIGRGLILHLSDLVH